MGYITSQTLTTALAILGMVPQSNPVISPAYSFFTTPATTVVPTIAANQTIYVSTSGSDANNGLTPGAPKLTIWGASGAVSAVSDVTTNWLIEIAAGTYTGADATKGHITTAKAMTTGTLYFRGTGTVKLVGSGTTTSSVNIGTTATTGWTFINITFGDATSPNTAGCINFQTSTNVSKLVFDGCTFDASGNTAGWCFYFNSVVAGTYRNGNYVGDIAFKNCTFSTGATGRVWSQGGASTTPIVGVMMWNCTGTFSTFSANRVLCSNFWVQGNNFNANGTNGSNFGIMWGTNTDGSTIPAGNNTCTNGYFYGNTFASGSGHAVLIGDNAQNILFDTNTVTCGGGTATAAIQGIVFKNAMGINCRNNTASGDCSSSGPNNTAGIYFKACTGFVATGNNCTATNNGYAIHVGNESGTGTGASMYGWIASNTAYATGNANAKSIAVDAYVQYPIIMDQNTYRFTSSAVLTGSAGIRGTACTTKANLLAAWITSVNTDEYYNDVNSTVVTV